MVYFPPAYQRDRPTVIPDQILLSWSGGKDSALALQAVLNDDAIQIKALLTTVTEGYNRISMHGVRRELLVQQANSLNLPLRQITIPQNCANETYNQLMRETLEDYLPQGIAGVAFGDVFLEDIRAYRVKRLAEVGLKGIFPLWGKDTAELAQSFLDQGFHAVLVCVDTEMLDGSFVGREYDAALLADLPQDVDPCGENGEFHTFVYDGPIFGHRLQVTRGERVLREGRYHFCDLIPTL